MTTTAMSQAITSLNEAHHRFGLTLTTDSSFFPEGPTNLPPPPSKPL